MVCPHCWKRHLDSKIRSDSDRFRLLLLGDGAVKKKLVEQATQQDLKNVIFIDSVPKNEVTRYWSLIDASIIHLKKSKLFTTVIPSKLFESAAMGNSRVAWCRRRVR